jgi:hypothetical protein
LFGQLLKFQRVSAIDHSAMSIGSGEWPNVERVRTIGSSTEPIQLHELIRQLRMLANLRS